MTCRRLELVSRATVCALACSAFFLPAAAQQQSSFTNILDSIDATAGPVSPPSSTSDDLASSTPAPSPTIASSTSSSASAFHTIFTSKLAFGWSSGHYVNLAPDTVEQSANEFDSLLSWMNPGALLAASSSSSPVASESSSTPMATSSSRATPSTTQSRRSSSLAAAESAPTSSSSQTAPSPQQTSAPDTSFSTTEKAWSKYDKIVTAHAVIGSIAWMIISPLAIVLARFARADSGAPKIHIWCQMIVTPLLTVVAVALGAVATNVYGDSHFADPHQRLGLVLLILLLLQIVIGRMAALRYDPGRKNKGKQRGYYIHAFFGVVLTALGFAQIYLGFRLYEKRSGRTTPVAVKVIWAIIVGLFSIYLILAALRKVWMPSVKSMRASAKSSKRASRLQQQQQQQQRQNSRYLHPNWSWEFIGGSHPAAISSRSAGSMEVPSQPSTTSQEMLQRPESALLPGAAAVGLARTSKIPIASMSGLSSSNTIVGAHSASSETASTSSSTARFATGQQAELGGAQVEGEAEADPFSDFGGSGAAGIGSHYPSLGSAGALALGLPVTREPLFRVIEEETMQSQDDADDDDEGDIRPGTAESDYESATSSSDSDENNRNASSKANVAKSSEEALAAAIHKGRSSPVRRKAVPLP